MKYWIWLKKKTVICLGQVNVWMNFFRRLPFVAKILDNTKKAQKIIVKNADCLDGKKELMGKKFQKLLRKSTKKKKENRELKKALTNHSQRVSFRPFRGAPSTAAGVGAGERDSTTISPLEVPLHTVEDEGLTQDIVAGIPMAHGLTTLNYQSLLSVPVPLHQTKLLTPEQIETRNFENGVQNADSGNKNAPNGRKIKVLFRELGENYAGSSNISVNQGHENRLDKSFNSVPRTIHPEIQCETKSENRRRNSKTV